MLFLVFGVLRLWAEVPSTVFANAVATFPSYWLNRNWAWGKTGRSHLMKEVVPFWIMAASGIGFSIVGASLAHHISTVHHLNHAEPTALVLAANVLSFGMFWVAKLLLFNRLFHVDELEEFDEQLEAEEAGRRGGPAPRRSRRQWRRSMRPSADACRSTARRPKWRSIRIG